MTHAATTVDHATASSETPVRLWLNTVPVTAVAQAGDDGTLVGALIPLPPAAPPVQESWIPLVHKLTATLPLLDRPHIRSGLFAVRVISSPHVGDAVIITRISERAAPAIPSPFHGFIRITHRGDHCELECQDASGMPLTQSTISEYGEAWGPAPHPAAALR